MAESLPDDGLVTRPAGPWVHEKLRILTEYFHAFGIACRSWGEWFYVDGLAGSGLNRIHEEGDAIVHGSPLLALRTEPPFAQCLLLEKEDANVLALRQRVDSYGRRAVVRQGDVNIDLLPMMESYLPRRHPTLVFLDPEGFDVHWPTIDAISRFRHYKWKAELMILFPEGIWRVAGVSPDSAGGWGPARLDAFWGSDPRWHDLDERVHYGDLRTPGQRRSAAIELYVAKLYELGYKTVWTRDIHEFDFGTRGPVKYILVFATDNDTGASIMDQCFMPKLMTPLEGIRPPVRRDL